MSNFVSLNTALTGLRAAQYGMDVASHNVSNANTTGYTRQRLNLVTGLPYHSSIGPMGSGVRIEGITRGRDAFLDGRARLAEGEAGATDLRAGLLRRTEAVLAEPDLGVSAELSQLWASFEDLALDPSDGAAREQVLSSLERVAARVRTVSGGWDALERDTGLRMGTAVSEVTDLAGRVAELNSAIAVARGSAPNDLLDERDLHLDRLAALTGATSTTETDGTVTVSIGGQTLVEGVTASAVSLDGPPGYALRVGGEVAVPRGELGGMQDFVVTDLPAQRVALDGFAQEFTDQLNAVHVAGYDLQGDAGLDLLVGTSARDLRVNPDVAGNPSRLAAAGGDGTSVEAHDGRNAQALAALRTAPGEGRTETVDQRLANLVVRLAGTVVATRRAAEAEDGLWVAAMTARQGAHGVSLDEEMVALVQYQRSLEAAARVMTSIDEALDVLINRTGLVGR